MRNYTVLIATCGLLLGENFPPAEVAILGDIDYTQKSEALQCPVEKQKFCALVFNGASGDRVEVAVTGAGKAFVAIADGSLTELARGTGRVALKLPAVADGLATYYIVFRPEQGNPSRFNVELRKAK